MDGKRRNMFVASPLKRRGSPWFSLGFQRRASGSYWNEWAVQDSNL